MLPELKDPIYLVTSHPYEIDWTGACHTCGLEVERHLRIREAPRHWWQRRPRHVRTWPVVLVRRCWHNPPHAPHWRARCRVCDETSIGSWFTVMAFANNHGRRHLPDA